MFANPFYNFKCQPYPQGSITQFFGENPELYSSLCGAPGLCLSGHNGLDCVAPWGTPIYSVSEGKVVEVKDQSDGYGKHVRILGEGYEWVYGHLSEIQCTLGQVVARGTQIGLMGNTGFIVSGSTPYWKYNPYAGTHLHLGRRPVENIGTDASKPHNVSYATGDVGTIPNYPGGFLGSVPITPDDFGQATPYLFTKDLYLGMKDPQVKELQKKLGVEQTGYFGPLTLAAVIKYQQKFSITPTLGYVGLKTRAKLNGG